MKERKKIKNKTIIHCYKKNKLIIKQKKTLNNNNNRKTK